MREAMKKADVLIEALPYIRKFHKKIFIIKYGGSILGEEHIRRCVLEDIAFLRFAGIRPIIVHGGGPNITMQLKKHKIESNFVGGVRVTDEFTLKIVREELNKLNSIIVEEISGHGVNSLGFNSESRILKTVKKNSDLDLGLVGEAVGFDKNKLKASLEEFVPVVSPMGVSDEGVDLNINADEVACFLAAELKAEKIVLLTNVPGVMRGSKEEKSLISTITVDEIESLVEGGVVGEGMIPKIRAAASAIHNGVNKAHIVDAKLSHALLLEIFTDSGVGTEIIN